MGRVSVGFGEAGQAHVEDLDRRWPRRWTAFDRRRQGRRRDHEVRGLDVAVNQPLLERVLQAQRRLADVELRVLDWLGAGLVYVVQLFDAVHELHMARNGNGPPRSVWKTVTMLG
jgi:hypothetical protein